MMATLTSETSVDVRPMWKDVFGFALITDGLPLLCEGIVACGGGVQQGGGGEVGCYSMGTVEC